MSEKKFTVRSGGRVRLELPAGKSSADTATPDERRHVGLLAADDDPTRYVFRASPAAVAFYDLGSRLRSVPVGTDPSPLRLRELISSDPAAPGTNHFSEYASIHTGDLGTEHEEGGQTYTLYSTADFTFVERGLLGPRHPDAAEDPEEPGTPLDPVDPFGFSQANGSARLVANCEELSVDRLTGAGVIIEVSAFYVTTAARTTREQRPEVDDLNSVYTGATGASFEPSVLLADKTWKTREPEGTDEAERWNPKDIESGAAHRLLDIPKAARLKAEGQLIVGRLIERETEGFGAWYQFSNAAGHFYGFDTGDTVRYKVTAEPRFDSEAITFTFKGADNRVYLRPYLAAPPLPSDFTVPVSSVRDNFFYILPPGSLVAAVAQGARVFYVWRVDESPALDVPAS